MKTKPVAAKAAEGTTAGNPKKGIARIHRGICDRGDARSRLRDDMVDGGKNMLSLMVVNRH